MAGLALPHPVYASVSALVDPAPSVVVLQDGVVVVQDGVAEPDVTAIDNANAALAGGDQDEKTTKTKKKKSRLLILYAYSETENARENLRYFVANGLHAAADA
ncbi:hypothetical protein DL764_001305 [Monosporascus ibericus]|uniref:Uncharacterized protein n=1 Tax=Monosporascus ibericus TaxID=155417 RepID=A0A4Q4TQ48_9PEZI|nr:hypothetical protein DL764_001305 [Monosporascus ibericus]